MVGGKNIRAGTRLFSVKDSSVSMIVLNRTGGSCEVAFEPWCGSKLGKSFGELVEGLGDVPLPPYIRRSAEESDKTAYQTIYAQSDGAQTLKEGKK